MLQIHSAVPFDEIEAVLRAAAQRHNASLLVISHLAPAHPEGTPQGPRDAFVFTLCLSKMYAKLLAAEIRFASFLPCRVATWPEAGGGVMLESVSPLEYCRLLGRSDLEPLAAPLESALRTILEDAAHPRAVSSASAAAGPHSWGATEDQVNMRATLPQRIDCSGTKVEEEGGTGTHDAPGG